MIENNFDDVRRLLINQMNNLSDDKLCKDESSLRIQTEKAKAMCGLSSQIVLLTKTQLEALEMKGEYDFRYSELPEVLNLGNGKI